jgi:hypothetical protein
VTDHSPESHIEGQPAVPGSSDLVLVPEVPFPAEYTTGLAREADGQQDADDREMTYEQCVAALQEAERLVDGARSACLQTIAAFEEDGPILVAKARERLQVHCLPEYHHSRDSVAKARQLEADLEWWLPYEGQFDPLLALVSGTTDYAVTVLMNDAINKIKALPFYRTGPADTAGVAALMAQMSENFNSLGDDLDEDAKAAAISRIFAAAETAGEKIRGLDEDLAKTSDFLNAMAGGGFLAGAQVAATLQAVAEYIEARSLYLMTYIEATDYFGKSDDDKERLALRANASKLAYEAITTAIGQYAPVILPKVFAQVPLIGGGFAAFDFVRSVNERRKLVEERKNHLLELARAHQGRGAADEVDDLRDDLRDDQEALDKLVTSTAEMCRRIITAVRSAQVPPPLRGPGS